MTPTTFFKLATGHANPYPYQVRMCKDWDTVQVVDVPTGLGKTESLLCSWLYQRLYGSTQRRMAYCLPARTLVEQTEAVVQACLQRVAPLFEEKGLPVPTVHVVMGGQADYEWERYPERSAIILGTQDMLLSRALNRPYGMGLNKARMHFGLLNNDTCWVFDEVQIMHEGLETSAQLQYLRDKMGTVLPSRSIWVSATIDVSRLSTVDQQEPLNVLTLDADDLAQPAVQAIRSAPKPLQISKFKVPKPWKGANEIREYANQILKAHVPGTKTLVYTNQKRRARLLCQTLRVQSKKSKKVIPLLLVHAGFRPVERKEHLRALEKMTEGIVISTQALEAGVDFSAQTLITEVAPWASLVQRFGRCNRDGRDSNAKVIVLPLVYSETTVPPYDQTDLETSLKLLKGLKDCSPQSLQAIQAPCTMTISQVPRRKDLIDLFDTGPDYAGNVQDVSSYIRDTGDDQSVLVYWRALQADDAGKKRPSDKEPPPHRSEICPVPIWEAKQFEGSKWKQNWDGEWYPVNPRGIIPGDILLLDVAEGGYSVEEGWTGKKDGPIPLPDIPSKATYKIGTSPWVSLVDHTEGLLAEFTKLCAQIPELKAWEKVLAEAMLYHDVGKAHPIQQERRRAAQCPDPNIQVVAKSPFHGRHSTRKMQRHELASALVYLQEQGRSKEAWLAAWLIASHHGKVHLSLRPHVNESVPTHTAYYTHGIWDGDEIPGVDLPGGRSTRPCKIDLHSGIMGLGEGSWRESMVDLRDRVGIFVLSYLEAIVRSMDWRASANGKEKKDA